MLSREQMLFNKKEGEDGKADSMLYPQKITRGFIHQASAKVITTLNTLRTITVYT